MSKQNRFFSGASLYGIVPMSPAERAAGRFMRAPDEHTGAPAGFDPNGNQGSDQNNQQGNNGDQSDDSKKKNNDGDEFDPEAFWNSDGDGDDDLPGDGDSAKKKTPSSSTDQDSKDDFGKSLVDRINGLNFDSVFTDDNVKKINEGDFGDVNDLINKNMRQAIHESMMTNVQVLKQFQTQMVTQVKEMIDGALSTQQNSDYLLEKIPSASNPRIGPAVRAIYDHALQRSKGDRERAVRETKAMLKTMSTETAEELGFDVAPSDPHSQRRAPAVNWLETLNER